MKTYVSYVVQNEKEHKHHSEIIDTPSPSYSFSPDPQVEDVIEWAEKKRKQLNKDEELIIVGMFKV